MQQCPAMVPRRLLSDREERLALRLARSQPESAPEFQELIERIRSAVIDAVVNHQQGSERLAGARFGVVGADLREDKVEGGNETGLRLGEVGLYDYDNDVLIVAVTDLRTGEVARLEERASVQPPLTAEELTEAKRIVLEDPEFRSLAQQPNLQLVAFPARAAFSDGHQRYRHRVFTVSLWTGQGQPSKVAEAAVDLSRRELVPVAEADLRDVFGRP